MNMLIKNTMDYVKDLLENDYSGHDYQHVLRVYNTATKIAERENDNLKLVQLAALLHDVDDIKLSPETYANKDNARNWLANKISDNEINTICEIINQVSYSANKNTKPSSIEAKCVQDADRLDAIGAIGIARAFMFGGNKNYIMYDPNIQPKTNINNDKYNNYKPTVINHFYEKLFKLKDLMNTETAKEIAEKRHNYMLDFINNFINEYENNI